MLHGAITAKTGAANTNWKAWFKFFGGLLSIFAAAAFFSSGYTPPGIGGEVIRHNQQENIDASPFFYGDVSNMAELIKGAEELSAD